MPDSFGNPTPEEVIQQLVQERNTQLNSAQTPSAQRNTMLRLFGQSLFGGVDPRLQKAQNREEAALAAGQLERADDETALGFEKRRLRSLFDSLVDIDPSTAAQVSEQLIQLENVELERTLLKQDIESNRLDIENEKRETDLKSRRFLWNPELAEYESLDIRDPHDAARIELVQRQRQSGESPEDITLTDFDGLMELIGEENAVRTAAGSGANDLLTNTRVDNTRAQLRAGADLMRTTADLFEVFNESTTDELSDPAKLDSLMAGIGNDLVDLRVREALISENVAGKSTTIADMSGQVFANANEYNEALVEEFLRGRSGEIMEQAGRRAAVKSLLTRLAYVAAKQLDSGGRLSDKDVELAWAMLGGDGRSERISARAIQTVLGNSLAFADEQRSIIGILNEQGGGKNSGHALLLETTLNMFDTELGRFETERSKLDAFGQASPINVNTTPEGDEFVGF